MKYLIVYEVFDIIILYAKIIIKYFVFLFFWVGYEGEFYYCKVLDSGGFCYKIEEEDERDGERRFFDRIWRFKWVCGGVG